MRRLGALLVAFLAFLTSSSLQVGGQENLADARDERNEVRDQKADAAAELDAAKADDADVAQALQDITDSITAQELDLEDARRQLEVAEGVAADAQADVDAANAEQELILGQLGDLAVVGFLNSSGEGEAVFFASTDPTQATRQASLLQLANTDADDLLENLRGVIEDRQISEAIAQSAVDEATLLELEMESLLGDLEDEREVQAQLKAELEARVQVWRDKLADIQAEEDELTRFIREEEARLAPPPPPNPSAPGTTSASGFQWPISAVVTSEFGYRIHPIFGTRRLHAGIDLGASTGSAIVAAKEGTVISAGWRGGYGNAVVISHGGGLSTLYAHQSSMAVSSGDVVGRGDVIGYVGSTGNSTGPHLHFEIRVNGDPTNPRQYLP